MSLKQTRKKQHKMNTVKFVQQAFVTNFRAGFIIFQAIGLKIYMNIYMTNYSILDTAHKAKETRTSHTIYGALDIFKQYLNKLTATK